MIGIVHTLPLISIVHTPPLISIVSSLDQYSCGMNTVQAARREADRLRQSEWERQRRDQLTVLKEREQSQLDAIEREISRLKNQMSLMVSSVSMALLHNII